MQLRWALEVEVTEGEAEAMYAGELPSPIPLWVMGGLLRHKDDLSDEHYYCVWSDDVGAEMWEAKIVGRSDHGDYIYHVRLC